MCVAVHESVGAMAETFYESLKRRVYITPKSFLDLLKSYEIFLGEKNKELSERRDTLSTGLSKLEETKSAVSKLTEEINEMQPKLQRSVEEQDVLQKQLEVDKFEADKRKRVVEEETKKFNERAEKVNKLF